MWAGPWIPGISDFSARRMSLKSLAVLSGDLRRALLATVMHAYMVAPQGSTCVLEMLFTGLKEVYLCPVLVDVYPRPIDCLEVESKHVEKVVEGMGWALDARDFGFFRKADVPEKSGSPLR